MRCCSTAGCWRMHPRSAIALRADPVRTTSKCPWRSSSSWAPGTAWIAESQCQLGETRASYSEQLGLGAVVGDEVWDQQSRVRIKLGPLTLRAVPGLPAGRRRRIRRCASLTRFFSRRRVRFRSAVDAGRRRKSRLRAGPRTDEQAPQLGWTTLGEDPRRCPTGPGRHGSATLSQMSEEDGLYGASI